MLSKTTVPKQIYLERINKVNTLEITKREVFTSIAIIATLLSIGLLIGNKISDYKNEKMAEYNTAIKIEDPELFQHAINTDIGNAFIYGTVEAIDPVTDNNIQGSYLKIVKDTEFYNMHTRTITNGKTTREEVYYTWDLMCTDIKTATQANFCGQVLNPAILNLNCTQYIDMVYENPSVRHTYHAVPAVVAGTVYTNIKDHQISTKHTQFSINRTISETIKSYKSPFELIFFWVFWLMLTIGTVIGFYMLQNNWLNKDANKQSYRN